MRIRIGHRLFVGFLLAALVVLAVSTGLTRWNFQRGFLSYVNESEADRLHYLSMTVADAYLDAGSWAPLRGNVERWLEVMSPPGVETASESLGTPEIRPEGWVGPARDGNAVAEDPLAISPRVSVLDQNGERLFGPVPSDAPQLVQPILVAGEAVGRLHLNPLETLASELDVRFAEQQTNWLFGSALAALVLAALLAITFARQMMAPLAELTRGTRALTAGKYGEKINVSSNDEFGDLANDFNTLTETLERHEKSQRQWIADISHELRTPLAILRGELHGVEDGVREFNETTRKSLEGEVERLTQLVDDFYELSVSDIGALRYRKAPDSVTDVLRETLEMFEKRIADAGLEFTARLPTEAVVATIDRVRLGQLFTNVLENSVRYTDTGGEIRVTCTSAGAKIRIDFEDSAPGVPDEHLEHLFERLYRVDSSRRRLTGGAGLGLAICENIAHAHGGTITAGHSTLGGLKITLELTASYA